MEYYLAIKTKTETLINLQDINQHQNNKKNLNITYCGIFVYITVLNDDILEMEDGLVVAKGGLCRGKVKSVGCGDNTTSQGILVILGLFLVSIVVVHP